MSRKIRMTLIAVLALVLASIGLLWFIVAQPILQLGGTKETPPQVVPARLETHVRMLSEQFFPRDCTHPDNLNQVAAYIRQEFLRANGVVSEQPYTVPPDFFKEFAPEFKEERYKRCVGNTYRNVIASFGPDTKERIVVGAHYDAFDLLPGADDNASGVAGLIELAYLLGGKTQLPIRVDLVAFTLEEPPFFRTNKAGSAVHAASLKNQGVPLRFMVSLEMIGYFDDTTGSQKLPSSILKLFYPSRGDFAVVVGSLDEVLLVRRIKAKMREGTALPIYSFNGPTSIRGIDWSDHMHYWEQGYDAVMVADTAIYRNMN